MALLFSSTIALPADNGARGDGGIISYEPVPVFESGQNAIIGWDGREEVLILSVDVNSEGDTKALHMVPFPSQPDVTLGSMASFHYLEQMIGPIYEYDGWDAPGHTGGNDEGGEASHEIVDKKTVGPHDVTTVKVNRASEFVDWVVDYLKGEGIDEPPLPEDLEPIVEHYLEMDVPYFVFDVIEVRSETRAVEPLVYRLDTDVLWFPLHISSMIEGFSDISLALLTPPNLPMNTSMMERRGFELKKTLGLDVGQLELVDGTLAEVIPGNAVLRVYEGYFNLHYLDKDVELGTVPGVKWMHQCDEPESYSAFYSTTRDMDGDGVMDVLVNDLNRVFLLDGEDGETVWELPCNRSHRRFQTLPPMPLDVDGDGELEVICAYPGGVTAIDGSDGGVLWCRNDIPDYVCDIITFADGEVGDPMVLVVENLTLRALNALNGSERWSEATDIPHRENWPEAVDLDGDGEKELVYPDGDQVHGREARNGSLMWTFDCGRDHRDIYVHPVPASGGTGVTVLHDTDLWTLNGSSGNVRWNAMYPVSVSEANIRTVQDIDADGTLEMVFYYPLGEKEGYYKVLNAQTGIQEWIVGEVKYGEIGPVPTVMNINDDERQELLCFVDGLIRAYASNGTVLWEVAATNTTPAYFLQPSYYNGTHRIHMVNGTTRTDLDGSDGSFLGTATSPEVYQYLTEIEWRQYEPDAPPMLYTDLLENLLKTGYNSSEELYTILQATNFGLISADDVDGDGLAEVVFAYKDAVYWYGYDEEAHPGDDGIQWYEASVPGPYDEYVPPGEDGEDGGDGEVEEDGEDGGDGEGEEEGGGPAGNGEVLAKIVVSVVLLGIVLVAGAYGLSRKRKRD